MKQVKIKLLFYLLLTLHTEQVFRLTRIGSQLAGSGYFLLTDAAYLGIQRNYQIVYRLNNGALHTLQRTGKVFHQRILLATVGYQPVAVQHHIVVLAYLTLNIGIGDARIGRQRLTQTLFFPFFQNIPSGGKLGVQRKQFFFVLCRLSHVKAGCRLNIG